MNGSHGDEWRGWTVRVGIVLALGLLLGRLGPFDTFTDLNAGARYAYWIGLTLLMWLQGIAALAALEASAGPRIGRIAKVVLAAVIGAVPTAFEVAWAEMVLRVERDLSALDVAAIFGDVCLLAVPLLLFTHVVVRLQGPAAPTSKNDTDEGADWLLSRLEPQNRGRLIALQSEDHYVRVRTTRGSQLVHMRFGDAVARLAGQGCQVHRSWWVAQEAVTTQSREGERVMLELVDGTRVPVSRSYTLAARNAGLIAA